jgi:hypothetical protein
MENIGLELRDPIDISALAGIGQELPKLFQACLRVHCGLARSAPSEEFIKPVTNKALTDNVMGCTFARPAPNGSGVEIQFAGNSRPGFKLLLRFFLEFHGNIVDISTVVRRTQDKK